MAPEDAPQVDPEPYDLEINDVARIVGVAPITVRRWLKSGHLDGLGIALPSGARRFRRSEIDAYIDGLRRKTEPAEAVS